ncbi:MAG: exo-alpha-sialidase [Planctomycetales bacterium]|nr:exo-alpha-sialidase [Planctomycetales bacterium]
MKRVRSSFRFLYVVVAFMAACVSAAEPLFETENIFPPGDKHCHSSSIVECSDGSLLTCWFYGSGERTAADVVVQGSRLLSGSKSWTPVFQMADTPEFPDCNPMLFIDKSDRVWMFWITVLAERWECSQLTYRRAASSAGNGAPDWNWQGVINLKPTDEFGKMLEARFEELGGEEEMWSEYAKPYQRMLIEAASDPYKRQTGWMTRTQPIVLPSGRILLPLYSDGFNVSLMGISDDDGNIWKPSLPIVGLGPIQPAIVQRKDGTVVAYCRDSGGKPNRVMMATSKDDGLTWSAATDTDIPNPGSSLEVISLNDGTWLMICNDTEKGRHRLTIMLSNDEGKTWPTKRTVEPSDSEGRSFGYPSMIQTRDGNIHLTYSYSSTSGRCIRHCVLNKEWILGK